MVRSRLLVGAALLLACPAAAMAAHAPARRAARDTAPEPDTLSLLALGTAGLVVGRRMSRSHRRA